MNLVDAICKSCGKAFRWVPVTAMICPHCAALLRQRDWKGDDCEPENAQPPH